MKSFEIGLYTCDKEEQWGVSVIEFPSILDQTDRHCGSVVRALVVTYDTLDTLTSDTLDTLTYETSMEMDWAVSKMPLTQLVGILYLIPYTSPILSPIPYTLYLPYKFALSALLNILTRYNNFIQL